jgi:[ribosomal protein S18]-alanine N-acetyltransferase
LDDMTAADLPRVAALERLSNPIPWSENAFRAELVNAAARCRVLRAGEDVAGFLVGWHLPGPGGSPGESQVAEFAVHPGHRGKGWGRRLMEDFLEEALRRKASVATLEVRAGNAAARALYGSMGFTQTGVRPRYYESREDALLMQKNIGPSA